MMRRLLILAGLAAMPGAGQLVGIYPIVDCVDFDATTNVMTVYYGYLNTNDKTIFVPYGASNYFQPNPAVRLQPNEFIQGRQRGAFTTTFSLNDTDFTTWTVLGQSATVTADALRCAGGINCWDTNQNGICDVSTEDRNGDGQCTPADCRGATGLTGAQGPQGSPGAAGPVGPPGPKGDSGLALALVNAAGSVSAQATCAAGFTLAGGGGSCTVPNRNAPEGRMAASAPDGANGWMVSCSNGTASAYAVCAKSQP